MARVTGLEPAASGVTGRRSNQLSYTRISDPKAGAGGDRAFQPLLSIHCLSMVFTFKIKAMVGGEGIEPPAPSV
jgi:hypothetical protein